MIKKCDYSSSFLAGYKVRLKMVVLLQVLFFGGALEESNSVQAQEELSGFDNFKVHLNVKNILQPTEEPHKPGFNPEPKGKTIFSKHPCGRYGVL